MNRSHLWRLLTLSVLLLPFLLRDGSTAPCGTLLVKKADKPVEAKANWANWRGPLQNGISLEKDLPDDFSTDPKKPKNVIWQADIGGRSTPIVMGDHVYLITSSGEKENEQE